MRYPLPLCLLLASAFTAPVQAPAQPVLALSDQVLAQALRDRAAWQGNRLGITDEVPPPWTPMTVSGATVFCWGRTYEYADSLLLGQVVSQGAPILAAPITLRIVASGQEVLLSTPAEQAITAAPNHVDVSTTAAAAGVMVHVLSHLEYDGCVKVELSLSPRGEPVVLDALELLIPVRPERALYYHWFEATRDPKLTNAGALPSTGLRSHFKPLLWLGDDDRGFCWFCEAPRGWANGDKEKVLSVEPGPGACLMRIRMADRPLVIAGTWRVTFGLMATPVRPMPEGWRDWLIPLNLTNPWSAWAPGFNNISGTDDPGTLTPRNREAMRRWVEAAHQRGFPVPFLPMREPMRVVPYSQIVFWSGKHRDGSPSPEITLFGPEWSYAPRPPGPRTEKPEEIPDKEYYWVCPASSFADFYIYQLNRLIDDTGIDGIYIDGPWNTCANPLHGCGYADDNGLWQREFKIWPYRELLKRIYVLFQQKRERPIIHHHTSCWLAIPCISFCHMMLDGEQYHDVGQKVEAHFLDVVPLDKWRAEHTGRQWGPAPFLLPDIPPQYCDTPEATRELLMLTNLHDTAIFPAGNNMREVMRNYQARRLFGIAACEFRGYWGNADWVRCDTPGCLVSVYRHPDGSRCLLVVGNTEKTEVSATVRPLFEGLNLATGSCHDAVDIETGERILLNDGAFTCLVKARDFRLIALPYYEAPPITAGDLRATALTSIPNPGFEEGLLGWTPVPVEGNEGSVDLDAQVAYSGANSCHIRKVEGPGGMMIQTDDVFAVEPGRKYRATCQLRIANSTGAKAYWMISQLDAQGRILGTNNLFSAFVTQNQEWSPLPFEFQPIEGTVAIRIHFLVAFPGVADVWVDDFRLELVE